MNKFSFRWLIFSILAVHLLLVASSAFLHSPTVDEPAYLASGLSHWRFGRFDLCKVSPPLVRLVAAIPVLMSHPTYNWEAYRVGPGIRGEHSVGKSFVVANGERAWMLFVYGRWATLPFSLLGGIVCCRWATQLWGQAAGIFALLLWCFSPNILGHAQLLTPDIGVTALCLTTCYSVWTWHNKRSWGATAVWGALLGASILAKTNAIALIPWMCLIFVLDFRSMTRTKVAQFLSGAFISFYVLNLGYGFQESFTPLGKFHFVSETFAGETNNRFEDTIFADVPMPVPAPFLEGIDLQRKDFENASGSFKTYLRGRWYDHGWWWYYLYVVGVKVPVATLGTLILSLFLLRYQLVRRDVTLFIILPGLMLFALPCSQTGFGHSLRYILPAFPFAFMLCASAVSPQISRGFQRCAWTLLALSVSSSVIQYPHSLSYFNYVSGGPRSGHFHLLDGNLDWGQDLGFIDAWIKRNERSESLYVAYWGFLPLREMGFNYAEPPLHDNEPIPSGIYVVSVNYLRGDYRSNHSAYQRLFEYPILERITPAIYAIQVD